MKKFNMTTKIFYIHGFGSSVDSPTLKLLQETFPQAIGLTYDYTDPFGSLIKLSREVNQYSIGEHVVTVGSSLGGWYAEQLTDRVVADFILYNPATNPSLSLAKYSVDQEVLYKYKQYQLYRQYLPSASRTVILSEDDEVIDHNCARIKYELNSDIIRTDGGHRMTPTNMKIITDKIKYLENQIGND